MKTRKNLNNFLVMSVFLLVTLCTAAEGGTIYVDDDAVGAGNGTSWTDAYNYLQDALGAAASGDEIRVAGGVYKPDQGAGITPSDRTATFQLISGVSIYGSIGGGESILSGDLNGDDVVVAGPCYDLLFEPTRVDNSYHVVNVSGTDATAVLDAFTITAGNANLDHPSPHANGSGMYSNSGSPTVTNCKFIGNSARDEGGGIININNSNPTLTNCIFSGNYAQAGGGGMYNNASSPTVTNCTFSDNYAHAGGGGMENFGYYGRCSPTLTNCTFSGNSAGWGGGMCDEYDSSPTLMNCTFSGNSANGGGGMGIGYKSSSTVTNCTFSDNSAYYGGGMIIQESGSATVTNCMFSGNSARWDGGGMHNWRGSPTVTNCTFSRNSALRWGGGMNNYISSSPRLINCVVWCNTGASGPQIYNDGTSSANVSYSDIKGGYSGDGNIDADPLFADADLRLSAGSPCIDAGDNDAVPAGVTTDLDGNPRIVNGNVDMGAYEGEVQGPPAGSPCEGQGPSVITVEIDIKPGSYPSSINLLSKGVTPVAIHTTSIGDGESQDFDATTVDPTTVLLNYLVAPLMWEIYDCDEFENPDYGLPGEPEMIGDGDVDLVLYFDTQELVATGAVEVGDEWAILTGATFGGTLIEGMGDVNIVVRGKP